MPKATSESLTLVNHLKELSARTAARAYKADVLENLLKESELVDALWKEVVGMVRALNKVGESVLPRPSILALSYSMIL